MALNGLAGAGQSKTTLLESKGIFEEKPTGEFVFLNGLFSRKKSASGSSTPKKSSQTQQQPDTTGKQMADSVKDKEKEAGLGSRQDAQAVKTSGESSDDPRDDFVDRSRSA